MRACGTGSEGITGTRGFCYGEKRASSLLYHCMWVGWGMYQERGMGFVGGEVT